MRGAAEPQHNVRSQVADFLPSVPPSVSVHRHTCSDLSFVLTTRFLWKTAVIVAVSSFPLYITKFLRARLAPPSYSKLAVS